MTNNRYPSNRWRERSRLEERDDRYSANYGRDSDRDERGWFDRAGDEVASWFGDEDAERRRRNDAQRDDDGWDRGDRSNRNAPSANYSERDPRWRDEGARRPYTGRFMNRSDNRGGSNYMPSYSSSGSSYGERFGPERAYHEDRFDRGQSQRDMAGRDFTGNAATSQGVHDPHYSEWRRRQIDSLDRDYDDYRRENQSRFENEFSNWRNERQGKRQLLGTVREHMNVVGADDEHLGTVDKVRGDRIVLTKSDSGDDQHHTIPCSLVDRIEADKVILNRNADEAKSMFGNDARDRGLFERDSERRENGPHMLERSFSGTYER